MKLLYSFLAFAAALTSLPRSSAAAVGGPPTIALVSGEFEYKSRETFPALAKELEQKLGAKCIFLARPEDQKAQTIEGLSALESADLLILMVRRMTLPEDQLNHFKKYLEAGKPLVALRTASHSFENWKSFDQEVLGGNYGNHHGNKFKTAISIAPGAENHPILKGVRGFVSNGSLYRNTPLRSGTTPLLMGSIEGQPAEPVAWTHQYKSGRVFYTSLGHPDDFNEPAFKTMLFNAIGWALNKPAGLSAKPGPPRRVEVEEFERLWKSKQGVVLDVRTDREYKDGHIPGAIQIDWNGPDFEAKAAKLDKNQVYLVHCAGGVRSAKACDKLSQMGFKYLVDLAPGLRAWEKAGKTLEKGTAK